MYIVHCPDRATSCLISLITLHISSQKLGEGRKWGNREKKGEKKAGKYQGKDKRRKNIIYKYAERKGDGTREEGTRKQEKKTI